MNALRSAKQENVFQRALGVDSILKNDGAGAPPDEDSKAFCVFVKTVVASRWKRRARPV